MKINANELDNIIGAYTAASGGDYEARTEVVEALAKQYDTSVNVIRAKLVAEGVYIKKEAAAPTSGGRAKIDIVCAFEAIMGVKLPSMHNMTKKDLEVMWEQFIKMSELRNIGENR